MVIQGRQEARAGILVKGKSESDTHRSRLIRNVKKSVSEEGEMKVEQAGGTWEERWNVKLCSSKAAAAIAARKGKRELAAGGGASSDRCGAGSTAVYTATVISKEETLVN